MQCLIKGEKTRDSINNAKLFSRLLLLSRSHRWVNEVLNSCLHQRQEKHINWLQTGVIQTTIQEKH